MGTINKILLMRMVLDVAVWAAVVHPAFGVGRLDFCMALYMGYLHIRLVQKHALTKCSLDDTPVLDLTSIAI